MPPPAPPPPPPPAPVAPPEPLTIAVCADPAKDIELLRAAARLAVDLNLPFLEKPARHGYDALLVVRADRLAVTVLRGEAALKGGNPVSAELDGIDIESAAGRSLQQPLAKAIGLKKRSDPPPVVIDATAGWCEDAWLMAGLGCHVLAVERNKIVHTLARDGVFRAGAQRAAVLMRLSLVQADARHLLRRLARLNQGGNEPAEELPSQVKDFLHPDVVYIDPMFPTGRKTAERKPMKLLRRLVGDDLDASELLEWALRVARKRVVVKRPIKAEALGAKPTTTHKGKSLRYDVYAVQNQD